MCLIWFSYENIPGFRLILAANRDEFLARATSPLAWRGDILAGWDEKDGGTWLGVNRQGQLAALTNYRDPVRQRPNPPSRGGIIPAYLRSGQPAASFLPEFQRQAGSYNPFNLLLFDGREVLFFSNVEDRIKPVTPGTHTLSNCLLDSDWPKTRRLTELLAPVVSAPGASTPRVAVSRASGPGQINVEQFFAALADRHQPEDGKLPTTGVGIDWERRLAPVFIANSHYGTRSSAVVTIDQSGRINFYERSYQYGDGATDITSDRHVGWYCYLR